jgi:hypothetical protein
MHSDAAGLTALEQYDISGGQVDFTDNTESYIVADYNGGLPLPIVITDGSLINGTTVIGMYTVFRRGTDLRFVFWGLAGVGLANKAMDRLSAVSKFQRESGIELGESGAGIFSVYPGYIWHGANRLYLDNCFSSTDQVILWQHVASAWTTSVVTTFNNSQYDNGVALATLSDGNYAVNYVYRLVSALTKRVAIVLGTGDYTLNQAQAARPPVALPNIPEDLMDEYVYVGRYIVKKGDSTSTEKDSAFELNCTRNAAADHDTLIRSVGGTIGDRQHITTAQVAKLDDLPLPLTEDLTMYVDGDSGDDADDGLAWGTAKKTLGFLMEGEADSIPHRLEADLTVMIRGTAIRARSSAGHCILKNFDGPGTITLEGVLTAVTTFTATEYENDLTVRGSGLWVKDPTKTWTPGAYRRHFVDIGQAYYYPCYDSSATTLWLGMDTPALVSAPAGTIYSAPELLRELEADPGNKYEFTNPKFFVSVNGCRCDVLIKNLWVDEDSGNWNWLEVSQSKDVYFDRVATSGVNCLWTDVVQFRSCYHYAGNSGFVGSYNSKSISWTISAIGGDGTGYGLNVDATPSCSFWGTVISDQLQGLIVNPQSSISSGKCYFKDCPDAVILNGGEYTIVNYDVTRDLGFENVTTCIGGCGSLTSWDSTVLGWDVTNGIMFSVDDIESLADWTASTVKSRTSLRMIYVDPATYLVESPNEYNNSISALAAHNYQDAIDELAVRGGIQSDIAYYVDGDAGSDAADGLAWGTAKKTMAFLYSGDADALPRELNANLLVHVRGTILGKTADRHTLIDGFYGSGTITIEGELADVLTGITPTGYENAVAEVDCHSYITAAATWTVNAHRGQYIQFTSPASAELYPIISNTATQLETIGLPDLAGTETFKIVKLAAEWKSATVADPTTLIQFGTNYDVMRAEGLGIFPILRRVNVGISSNLHSSSSTVIWGGNAPIKFVNSALVGEDLDFDATSLVKECTIGLLMQPGTLPYVNSCAIVQTSGAYATISLYGTTGGINVKRSVFLGSGADFTLGIGAWAQGTQILISDCRFTNFYCGLMVYNGGYVTYPNNSLFENCLHGIYTDGMLDVGFGTLRFRDNTHAIYLVDGGRMRFCAESATMVGSGNTYDITLSSTPTPEGLTFAQLALKTPKSNFNTGAAVYYYDADGFIAQANSGNSASVEYVDAEVQRVSTGALNATDATSTGVGKLTFAATRVNMRHTSDHSGKIYEYTIPEIELTFTDGLTEYVVAEYNGGSPRFVKETNTALLNNSDRIPIWLCWRIGSTVHQMNGDNAGLGLANKIATMLTSTQAYRRAGDSGLVFYESVTPNPRTVVGSGGYIFSGFNGILVGGYTSATDLLTLATVDDLTWTYSSAALVYNNTDYNPITGTVPADAHKWVVRWFYRSIGDVKEVFYVYGLLQHANQGDAELEGERTDLPNVIKQHCVLVGRAVIRKGDTSGHIDSTWPMSIGHSAVIAHNDTGFLNTGDYQHLTAAELTTTRLLPTSWVDEQRYGIVAPLTTTTIAFNDSTYQFTLGSVGANWSYWRTGIRYTITGAKTVTLAGTPPTAGTYYVYIDAINGDLTASTSSPWTLADTKVPVAIIAWDNAATPKYFLADERHSCEIHRAYHREHHFADGAELVTGGTVADYVVNEGSPAGDDDNTFSIAETVFYDEDKISTCATLPDPSGAGGDCMTFTRTGATTYGWAWSDVPFVYTTSGYINYNVAGTSTQGQSGKFYCTYLFATNFAGDGRFVNLMGRGEYSTLSEAEAENVGLFDLTGFPVAESILLYRFVWATDSSYTTKGKVRLAVEPIAIMRSFVAIQNLASDKPVRVLNDLNDVTITSSTLAVDQSLFYAGNGQWVNKTGVVSAGVGIDFYDATPVINSRSIPAGLIQAGTSGNGIQVNTLSKTAVLTTEQVQQGLSVNDTRAYAAWLYNTALGRTTIDAGPWAFNLYMGVSSTGGGRVTRNARNLYQVVPVSSGAVTTTDLGANTKTATITSSQFAGTYFAANATNTTASYLQTPSGIYQISAVASVNSVTIIVPTGYVNETGVTFNVWNKLFAATSPAVTALSPAYAEYSHSVAAPAFTVAVTDKLGAIDFVTSNNTTTLSQTYDGTTRNSRMRTPLITLHNNLAGINAVGGNVQHLTDLQLSGLTGGGSTTLHSHAAASPTTITVAAEASDTTCYPLFVTNNIGDLAPKTHASWGFDALNCRMGLGIAVPTAMLDVYSTGTADIFTRAVGDAASAVHRFYRAKAGPGALTADTWIGGHTYSGYAQTGYVLCAFTGAWAAAPFTDISAPTYYTIHTTPAGSITATERMRISAAGYVGIGTAAPTSLLDVAANAAVYCQISAFGADAPYLILTRGKGTQANSTAVLKDEVLGYVNFAGTYGNGVGTGVGAGGAWISATASENWGTGTIGAYMSFVTTATGTSNRTEKMRLTGLGQLWMGTTAGAIFSGTTYNYKLHIAGSDSGNDVHGLALEASAIHNRINLFRHQGTLAAKTAVASGHTLGGLYWSGWDGGVTPSYVTASAIVSGVDATVSEDVVSGNIQFWTSNASGAYAERARLSGAGYFGIGTGDLDGTPVAGRLTVTGDSNNGATMIFVGRDVDEANVAWLDTDGKLGLGTLGAPAVNLDVHSPTAGFTAIRAVAFGAAYATLSVNRATGTQASPAAVSLGNYLGIVQWAGYYNATTQIESAQIVAEATETWEVNKYGANLLFLTTLTGAATPTERMRFSAATGEVQINTGLVPDANDGAYLGTTALGWADLHLATGGVINWANGNVTLTHSAATLTLAATTLALGATNITMSGSIGVTGTRVTKGWFTAVETNGLTLNGATSGTTALAANATAGTTTQTFQAVNGVVYCSTGTDVAYTDGGTGISTYPTRTIIMGANSASLGTATPCTRATRQLDTNKQVVDSIIFPASGVAIAWFNFPIPDAYDSGTFIVTVYYYSVTSEAANFRFQAAMSAAADGEAIDVALGTTVLVTAACSGTALFQKVATFGAITASPTPAPAHKMFLKLWRDPDEGSDNATIDAHVTDIKIEFVANAWTD